MKIGLIGLGKMGINLSLNAIEKNHQIVAYDIKKVQIDSIVRKGLTPAYSLVDLINKLPQKKIIWIMITAGDPVEQVLSKIFLMLNENAVVVDGGNSFYKDSVRRAKKLAERGITLLDIGVSGGISGARNGASMMVGGDKKTYNTIEPFLKSVCVTNGYGYVGPSGAGHYAKMIHNAIEYGMMQAIAEGYEILKESHFNFDLSEISKVFKNGSVIRSWLLELLFEQLQEDPFLEKYSGKVGHSGECQWAIEEAKEMGIDIQAIKASLDMRLGSQNNPTFGSKTLSAMRHAFGGHKEKN